LVGVDLNHKLRLSESRRPDFVSGGFEGRLFYACNQAEIGLRNDLSEQRQPFPAQAKGSMPAGLRHFLFTVDEQVGEQVDEQVCFWDQPKLIKYLI
jgi:hypothetical protein